MFVITDNDESTTNAAGGRVCRDLTFPQVNLSATSQSRQTRK